MKIRFKKTGLVFSYHGDTLVRAWPWLPISKFHKYYSTNYDFYTGTLSEYWMKLGRINAQDTNSSERIDGIYFEDMLTKWIATTLRFGYFVVLYDINIGAKSAELWNKLPENDRKKFKADVVYIKCRDVKEVEQICNSVSCDFALALGVSSGNIIYANEDHRKLETTYPFSSKQIQKL